MLGQLVSLPKSTIGANGMCGEMPGNTLTFSILQVEGILGQLASLPWRHASAHAMQASVSAAVSVCVLLAGGGHAGWRHCCGVTSNRQRLSTTES